MNSRRVYDDFSPKGRAEFAAAVEAEKRLIAARGLVEFMDERGVTHRIRVPVVPTRWCARGCGAVTVGGMEMCFTHHIEAKCESARKAG